MRAGLEPSPRSATAPGQFNVQNILERDRPPWSPSDRFMHSFHTIFSGPGCVGAVHLGEERQKSMSTWTKESLDL